MFVISRDAAAIQAAYHKGGAWTVVAELRRHVASPDSEAAHCSVPVIAGWAPTQPRDAPEA